MNIFQELKESRMFGNVDTLDGQKVSSLASMAYLMMLMLELKRKEKDSWSKKYAESTIKYNDFESMRLNGTDLHNILAVLNHTDVYDGRLDVDVKVSVPVLGLRRYFKDVRDGRHEPKLDRELFTRLESQLSIHDSQLKSLRREILDWSMTDDSEKDMVFAIIKRLLNKHAYRSDIAVYFNSK